MLVWEGPVGHVTVNERATLLKRKRGQRVTWEVGKGERYRGGLDEMTLAFRQQWRGIPMVGPVLVHVRTYFPRVHRKGAAEGEAFGDVDACIKAALDALNGSVLEDDSQVVTVIASKHHDAKRPRIEVEVKQWEA